LFLGPRAELVAARFRSSRLRRRGGAKGAGARTTKRYSGANRARGWARDGVGEEREGLRYPRGTFSPSLADPTRPFHPVGGKVAARGYGIRAPGDKNAKQKADYVTEG